MTRVVGEDGVILLDQPGTRERAGGCCRWFAGLDQVPPPPREVAGWSGPLRAWADEALAAGVENIHAEAYAEFERVLLDAALAAHRGHRQHAAKSLGLSRNTMTRKLGSSRKKRR